MTVLERQSQTHRHFGFVPYLLVGALSVAIGVGIGLNVGTVADDVFESVPQQAMIERGVEVGEHLDTMWSTGLAQQAAMREARILQHRIDTGLAQQAAMREARILQHRIDTGLIQGELIKAEAAPRRAMEIRGEAMADHVESLIHTGLVQQELMGE